MRTSILALLAIAACAASACTKTLNMDGTKSAVSAGLTEKTGIVFSAVTCPETREIKAGDTFECTAVAQTGGELKVKVTQKDDTGNIAWELAGGQSLVDLTALQGEIKNGLKAQMSVDADVDCGGKYRIAVAAKTFECTAKAGTAQTTIVVTMKDDQGNVGWATK